MMAFSHILIGMSSWALAVRFTNAPLNEFAVAAVVAGSLLPDIDHPGSWLGRRLLPVSMFLGSIFGHRGVTHSLIAVVAMIAVIVLWGGAAYSTVAALAVGYLSHLGADLLTNSGIPLLWPSQRRFALPLASTGGLREWILVLGVCGFSVWLTGEHLIVQYDRLLEQGAGHLFP